jgi:hypothetical protein
VLALSANGASAGANVPQVKVPINVHTNPSKGLIEIYSIQYGATHTSTGSVGNAAKAGSGKAAIGEIIVNKGKGATNRRLLRTAAPQNNNSVVLCPSINLTTPQA